MGENMIKVSNIFSYKINKFLHEKIKKTDGSCQNIFSLHFIKNVVNGNWKSSKIKIKTSLPHKATTIVELFTYQLMTMYFIT